MAVRRRWRRLVPGALLLQFRRGLRLLHRGVRASRCSTPAPRSGSPSRWEGTRIMIEQAEPNRRSWPAGWRIRTGAASICRSKSPMCRLCTHRRSPLARPSSPARRDHWSRRDRSLLGNRRFSRAGPDGCIPALLRSSRQRDDLVAQAGVTFRRLWSGLPERANDGPYGQIGHEAQASGRRGGARRRTRRWSRRNLGARCRYSRASEQAARRRAGSRWSDSADDLLADPMSVAVTIEAATASLAMARAAITCRWPSSSSRFQRLMGRALRCATCTSQMGSCSAAAQASSSFPSGHTRGCSARSLRSAPICTVVR